MAALLIGLCSLALVSPAYSLDTLVDLGYGRYNGSSNSTTNLTVWKGIRYAQAARWQAPAVPAANTTVVQATAFGSMCPQGYPAVGAVPFIPGDEDCLFVNVYAPSNAMSLPVMVWIHGGGYGLGDGTQDMTAIINANGNNFVVVAIQYRLGAFGFLSSEEVKSKGVLNAGILDQAFALQWVQDHIAKFGGDPSRVTITGESAGGGSVMIHAMAKGGTLGTSLWQNGIASSPYDPGQSPYNGSQPTKAFYDFSKAAGCGSSGAVLDCLAGKDTWTLQYANGNVSIEGSYASWAFLPVTDYSYITDIPSAQLNAKKVNGKRLLIGNNANEGSVFVPANISTLDGLTSWLHSDFPELSDAQVQAVIAAYPSPAGPDNPNALRIETNGNGWPSAVNVSQVATGHQQQAYNIYSEAIFTCPGYWLGFAFTGNNRTAYHYQFSVPFASHGADVVAIFGPAGNNIGPQFSEAMMKIWGNFITQNDPSIPSSLATGTNGTSPISAWPAWSDTNPMMFNLNQTGGVLVSQPGATAGAINVTVYTEPGLQNDFTLANAYTWEGGRGQRCEFWRSIAASVPE